MITYSTISVQTKQKWVKHGEKTQSMIECPGEREPPPPTLSATSLARCPPQASRHPLRWPLRPTPFRSTPSLSDDDEVELMD
jgi:hypothetical protein